ncbi:MAG: CIA30 family protein [Planctomycetota bacterium]
MRSLFTLVVVTTVALGTLAVTPRAQAAEADSTIVELAVGTDALSTLVAAVKAAGLVDTLAGDGPFTVFAPTNEAFAKLPKGAVERLLLPENKSALIELLTYHVVPGAYSATSALQRGELGTVAGPGLTVELRGGRLMVGEAGVIANDINASNGVVHLIDSVLIPPRAKPKSPEEARTNLFVRAIEQGAPLFNNGSPEGCAAVYEIAVQAVIDLSADLDSKLADTLRAALETSLTQESAVDRAWTLRGAMDRALAQWNNASPSNAPSERNDEGKLVFSFDGSQKWFSVNDDVMGGISNGRMEFTGNGTGKFVGELSLENNGGFSTVRSPGQSLDLEGFDGFVLRVRGDGRTYGFSALPTDRRYEINTWRTNFKTRAGEWQEIRVPFDSLVHQVMGRRIPATGALPPEKIRSVAFSVSDKNEAPFALEIDSIRAYRATTEVTGNNPDVHSHAGTNVSTRH